MNFKKSTRYALYAAMELARVEAGAPVAVSQVAERYKIPATVLAKVFQQLVRRGLVLGTRGTHGGYTLARPASELTVLDVISAFEPPRAPERCLLAEADEPDCARRELCRLRRLFDEVDEVARSTYASVTLDTLIGRRPRYRGPLQLAR